MKKVYVIIVTYNAIPWIDKCIGGILNSSIPCKVIVVDNVSTDDTVKYIRKNYPQVKMLVQNKNLGFGAGNNLGIKIALNEGADYIYLLNQDAWLPQNGLQILVETMEKYQDFGMVSPMQITANGLSLDRNFCRTITRNESLSEKVLSDYVTGNINDIYDSNFFQAAHWLLSAKCINKVGLFSPIFRHYGEDGNYMKRVKFHGFKRGIVPAVKGVHDREFRNNDNIASKSYFFFQQFLGKASDVNIKGIPKFMNIVTYIIAFVFYKVFIDFYFLFSSETRRYFKDVPNPIALLKDVRNNRFPYRNF